MYSEAILFFEVNLKKKRFAFAREIHDYPLYTVTVSLSEHQSERLLPPQELWLSNNGILLQGVGGCRVDFIES